jgi:hypothetical protein
MALTRYKSRHRRISSPATHIEQAAGNSGTDEFEYDARVPIRRRYMRPDLVTGEKTLGSLVLRAALDLVPPAAHAVIGHNVHQVPSIFE